MQRKEWHFNYTSQKLADAAAEKKLHHSKRLTWWQDKQSAVISEVREKGLEVNESIAAEYALSSFIAGGGVPRGAQIVVKDDYQVKLNECHQKIQHHSGRVEEYDGWLQMLAANPDQTVELDIDDWLFFFRK